MKAQSLSVNYNNHVVQLVAKKKEKSSFLEGGGFVALTILLIHVQYTLECIRTPSLRRTRHSILIQRIKRSTCERMLKEISHGL